MVLGGLYVYSELQRWSSHFSVSYIAFFRCIFRVGSNNGYPQILTISIGVLPDYVTWSEGRPYLKHISKAPLQRHPRSLC